MNKLIEAIQMAESDSQLLDIAQQVDDAMVKKVNKLGGNSWFVNNALKDSVQLAFGEE